MVVAIALVGCQSKAKEAPSEEAKVANAAEQVAADAVLLIPSLGFAVDAPVGSSFAPDSDSSFFIRTADFGLLVREVAAETLQHAETEFSSTHKVLHSEKDGNNYAIHAVYEASMGSNQHTVHVQREVGEKTYRCSGTTEIETQIATMLRVCKSLRASD